MCALLSSQSVRQSWGCRCRQLHQLYAAGVCATDLYVDGIAAVVVGDDDVVANKGSGGGEDGLAEFLHGRKMCTIVDVNMHNFWG